MKPIQLPRPLQPSPFGSPVVRHHPHILLSCGELTVILKDVANQLLLLILGDVDPAIIELSSEEEAIEVELKKRMTKNAKLPY